MKKLLNISVIAALAILPMAANAAVTDADPGATNSSGPVAANAPKYSLAQADATDTTHVATAGYVKGAYNAAIKAINKVADMATNATDSANISYDNTDSGLTATNVQAAIDELADEKLDASDANVASAGNYISAGTGVAANLTALDNAVDGLADSKLDASEADVATAGNYISAGTDVAANLGALDDAVKDNEDAITVLNGDASTTGSVAKQIADAVTGLGMSDYAKKTGVTQTITNSTISGTVPVLTVWDDPTSATTVGITASITGATYAEPAAAPEPEPEPEEP